MVRGPETLDLYEQLIEATRLSGHASEAFQIFLDNTRGIEGLGATAGEYGRGLRLLSGFSANHNPQDAARTLHSPLPALFLGEWATFAHSLGDLGNAAVAIEAGLQYASGENVRVMMRSVLMRNASAMAVGRGELPEAIRYARLAIAAETRAKEGKIGKSKSRLALALHLSGQREEADELLRAVRQSQTVLVDLLGRAALDVGRPTLAKVLAGWGQRFEAERPTWEDAEAAALLARIALSPRRATDPDHKPSIAAARTQLEVLGEWANRSGWMDHLVRLAAQRAEIAYAVGDLPGALQQAEAGLVHASGCGYRLHEIELLCLRARAHLALGNTDAALRDGEAAKDRSADPRCGYPWGVARAGRIVADTLEMAGRADEATSERNTADTLMGQLETIYNPEAYIPASQGSQPPLE